MEAQTPENIILIGFMGCGKTTIGRLAAKALDFEFLDTDQLIIERTGRSISDLFAEFGEEYFRDQETAVIRSLVTASRCVIATGGGAVIRPENREMLRRSGFVVRLTACEDVLLERVSRNSKRPLLQCENPREAVRKLLASREEAYEHAADWTLDTSALTIPEAVDALSLATQRHFAWNPSSSSND
jgi:shikimate kinase